MIITFKNLRRAVAAIALVGTFVVAGCTGEIEKRVSELEDRVASLEQLTQALNAKLGDNLLVKSVTSVGGGWDIVFSNDSRIEVRPPVDGEDGEDGADGVSPKIKVAPNGDDGLSIWYNITKDYPESGWVNTEINIQGEPGESGLDISSLFEMQITDDGKLQYTLDGETWVDVLDVSGLGGTAIVVRENPDGTVTFVTADGEYTFAQAQGPVSPITGFTLLWSTEEDIKVGDTPQAAFIVRISPSDAPMPAVGMWTLDEVTSGLTRASYLNPSKVLEIASIEKDKIEDDVLDGQYVIKVKGAVGEIPDDDFDLALVLNVGTTSAPSLISSDVFQMGLAEGELTVEDDDSLEIIKDGLNDDGYEKADPYSFKFKPADETTWTMTITSPAPKTRAEYNDAAEWVTVGIKGGSEYPGPQESDSGSEVDLEITLDPNNTGKSRSAVITISTEKEEEEGKGDPDGYGEFSFTITQEDAFDVLVDGKLKKAMVDALKVKLDLSANEPLSKADAKKETSLDLTYVEDEIELTGADLAGLAEFFPDLTSLILSDHEALGAVDLSGFDKLSELKINRAGLTSLTLPTPKDAAITKLQLTDNEDLTSIDLSKATSLVRLDLSGNGLTTIALPAKAEDLTSLEVNDNKLASITLPEAEALETLDVSNNLLKSLDITMLDKDVLANLTVEGNPGDLKKAATRAAATYEFKVKVWKQFDVEEEVGEHWPENKATWQYYLTDVESVIVEVIYDVTPSVYATSVEIKSLNSKKPLAGSAGARTVTITTADTLSLKALITPANADNKTVVWDSSDDDIASIDPTTGKLTIKTAGQVIFNVDAKGYETGKEQPFDKVTITINPAVRATGIQIGVYSSDELTEGNLVEDVEAIAKPTESDGIVYLGATVTPSDATLKDNVVWSITDDDDDAFSIVGNKITIDYNKVNFADSIVVTATIEHGLAFGEDKKESITLQIEADVE